MRPSLLGLLALATACATQTSGGARRILDVSIEGNRALGDGALASGLATHGPRGPLFGLIMRKYETWDPLAAELDRKRIERTYAAQGFFDARVTNVIVQRVGADGVKVQFVVREGRPTRLVSLELEVVQGAHRPGVDGAALRRRAGLQPGARLVHRQYLAAKERIRHDLFVRGFAHVRVDGEVAVDRDERTARVSLAVAPGPRARFGETRIRGLSRVPASAIRARLAWAPGERFDPDKLALTEGRLYKLGLFATVRIDYDKEGAPPVTDVTIAVSESAPRELRVGAGVAVDRARLEVRARASWLKHGFLQPLATLRLDARPGYAFVRAPGGDQGVTGAVFAELERLDFLVPRVRAVVDAGYRVDELDAYTAFGPELRVALDRPFLTDRLLLGLGWQWRYLGFRRLGPGLDAPEVRAAIGLDGTYQLGYFEQSLAYDRRDRPLDARRGAYAEVRLEEGGPWAGGAFRYTKVTPDLRVYLPIGKRAVLAGKLRLGRFIGSGEAPVTQRYFAGGATSHRGFPFRRLSPVATDMASRTTPIGGEALFETSVEARLDVRKVGGRWLGVALFLDGGDVTMDPKALKLTNLHWAAGVGLRYHTPIGALRLDVGYRLNRRGPTDPEPDEPFALHLSLGEAF